VLKGLGHFLLTFPFELFIVELRTPAMPQDVVVVDDDDDDVVVVVVEECSIKYVRKWKTRCKGVASGI
jgi:hypothetical protein